MTRLSEGAFGPSGKPLAELSDDELRAERARRRGEEPSPDERPTLQRVKQYLANLELGPDATWPEVERAYRRLRDRYRPDKHAASPERHQAAQDLADSLGRAYRGLRRYFGDR